MRVFGVIPARYPSSRFEGKPLALLAGKPMIEHVYRSARESSLLTDLVVATDDERIFQAVEGFGGRAMMTSADHPSGTDRVAEVARGVEADVVVNIQGDEPFISPLVIDQLVEPFRREDTLEMSTLMRKIRDPEALTDPNVVKVVIDRDGYALYFSRALIPYPRRGEGASAFEHIGLYAYSKRFLLAYANLEPATLERVEGLEQLRVLENGHRIRVVETHDHLGLSVDTPADLAKAEAYLARLASG